MEEHKAKAVILAGGKGTRLMPLTEVTNKVLLPIYDRPMIESPLETVKNMGIKEVCIVTSREHLSSFMKFLGSGESRGMKFTYVVQEKPLGNAHAFLQAENFAKGSKVVLIFGDNIFENVDVPKYALDDRNSYIFIKEVRGPQRFGVATMDHEGNVIDIEEKPKNPKSNSAVTGLYIYPSDVFDIAKTLKPSKRGELEIVEVINHYIKQKRVKVIGVKGYWLDTGNFEYLLKASILRAIAVDPSIIEGIDMKKLRKTLTDI